MKQTLQSDLHAKTGGVHIVGLFIPDGVVCIAEDIGRHNALDRVIGYGLLNNVIFSHTFAVSSGRVSSEMVRKCLVAGIPVIVSRSATTSLAVEMAENTGLTIIGFARSDQMNIYTHPERVRGAGTGD
jgi:FdhD protein